MKVVGDNMAGKTAEYDRGGAYYSHFEGMKKRIGDDRDQPLGPGGSALSSEDAASPSTRCGRRGATLERSHHREREHARVAVHGAALVAQAKALALL